MTQRKHSSKSVQSDSDLSLLRNIGIIAHVDAGKTTVTERILYFAGESHKIGSVDDGTTQMDHMAQERERGITITSAATNVDWKKHQINLIDTPGHVDFTAEVERSLRVLDGVVVVLDSVAGVQAQSVKVWRQAGNHGVPRIVFVNKMDRIGANFNYAISTLHNRLHANAVPIQLPIGQESEFQGTIDLVTMQAFVYESNDAVQPTRIDIPAEHRQLAESAREELVAKVAEYDDELANMYLNGDDIEPEGLRRSIREATIKMQIFPVLAGSAMRHRGIHQLLDAVIDYLPSPTDLPPVKGFLPSDPSIGIERRPREDEPLSALAFKLVSHPQSGKLLYIRVYSGILKKGMSVHNPATRRRERIGRLLMMHAATSTDVEQAGPGEIVAAIGLKNTTTGHTLCSENAHIAMEPIEFPDPVLSISVEPLNRSDQDRLTLSLQKLEAEDPTLKLNTDEESKQMILSGMGELHLEVILDRLHREGIRCTRGRPRVAYRETISKESEAEGRHIRQTGGRGQFGVCTLRLEPLEPGSGIQFESEISGAVLPAEWRSAIEKGVRGAAMSGVFKGYPVVDVKAVLIDGKQHETDSSEAAFITAGSIAFKEAMRRAAPQVLEPVMLLEVIAPSETVGHLMGDISSRGGRIDRMENTESRAGAGVVNIGAYVPLAKTFNYSTDLRSATSGEGDFTMQLDHYGVVPDSRLEEIGAS